MLDYFAFCYTTTGSHVEEMVQKHSGGLWTMRCDASLQLQACGQDWIMTASLEKLLTKGYRVHW